MRTILFGALVAACAAATAVTIPAQEPAAVQRTAATPAHYLVFETMDNGDLRPTSHRRVSLASPLETLDAEGATARVASVVGRQGRAATIRLRDAAGRVVYQTVVTIPTALRVETIRQRNVGRGRDRGGEGAIDGQTSTTNQAAIAVRVPALAGASRLEVIHERPAELGVASSAQEFDLEALETQFAGADEVRAAATTIEAVPNRTGGASGNRLDVLIVGEGYRAQDLASFRAHTDALATGFLDASPFREYRNHFNFWRMHVPSTQAGADRPVCPDDPQPGDIDNGTMVSTAFDATFCSAPSSGADKIWRLLTVNTSKVLDAAADLPEADVIIVVVRTEVDGGSGGSMAVMSLSPTLTVDAEVIGTMLHEFGHYFGNLGDEYVDANTAASYDACSDINALTSDNCEPNVTDETVRSKVKWNRWIAAATPVPTSGSFTDPRTAGLWEGSRYLSDDMYRQCFSGRMRNSLRAFCAVDSEVLLLRLYNGGWGAPSSGIFTIEPGTRSPSSASVLINPGQNLRLQARVLGPALGPTLRVEWLINGIRVVDTTAATGTLASFNYVEFEPGMTATITMRVSDRSGLIHSTQRHLTSSQQQWVVTVSGGACPTCQPF